MVASYALKSKWLLLYYTTDFYHIRTYINLYPAIFAPLLNNIYGIHLLNPDYYNFILVRNYEALYYY